MSPDARAIVRALKGRWAGNTGNCRCPAHDDRSPSLSVTESRDGGVLVYCHAGCAQKDVIGALQGLGLWPGGSNWEPKPVRAAPKDNREETVRMFLARSVWNEAMSISGSIYLVKRGITLSIPPSVRFHRALKHPADNQTKPALVFAIQDPQGRITGVQRIFLNDAADAKTDARPAKMTLGVLGEGAVRLGPAEEHVGLAEGPETALSAMQMFGLPVWCSCGAARMKRVKFPPSVKTVHIFADAGEIGHKCAFDAMKVFQEKGLKVAMRIPAEGDWNDVLQQMMGEGNG